MCRCLHRQLIADLQPISHIFTSPASTCEFPTIHHLPCPALAISSLSPFKSQPPSHQLIAHDEAGGPRDAEFASEGSILVDDRLPLGIGHVGFERFALKGFVRQFSVGPHSQVFATVPRSCPQTSRHHSPIQQSIHH